MLQGRLKMLKHDLSQEYASWNESVSKSFLKKNIDWAERTPATEKAQRLTEQYNNLYSQQCPEYKK